MEPGALTAASTRIRNLESLFGVPLLLRNPRGVNLTPAGHTLAHYARAVFQQIENLRGEFEEHTGGFKGQVRVFATSVALNEFLPQALSSFLIKYPGVNIDVEERLSNEIIRKKGVSQQFLTVWTPCLFGEFVSPLSSLSSRRTCPAEICFPPFRLSKPSGQNYLRLDAWQWVCRQRQGGFAGQRFSLAGERICGGSLITFCSAALTTKSECSSSAITIDIHLLDPDVDRSMAEYEVGNFHQGRNPWKVAEAKVWSILVNPRTLFTCVLIIFYLPSAGL
jgi:DNA-binding transcriptional LysR family regulator